MATLSHLLISFLFIVSRSSGSSIVNPSKVKQVSWKPRAFVYEGFLTEEECDHMVQIVADIVSGKSKLSEVRTSFGMFIKKNKGRMQAAVVFILHQGPTQDSPCM